MKESLSSNQITVNRHQRTVHENEKPFKCEIFQKSFGGERSKTEPFKNRPSKRSVFEWIRNLNV